MKRYKVSLYLEERWHEWIMIARNHEAAKVKAFRRFGITSGRHWMFGTHEIK